MAKNSYDGVVQLQLHKKNLTDPKRFCRISEREDRSDIPPETWALMVKNNCLQTWKDIIIWKGLTEMQLYPQLIHELKPKTVIEIGAFNGGSAVWLADHLEIFKIPSHVYAMDIDIGLVDERAKKDTRITFIQGDSNKIQEAFPKEMLHSLPHPWLIIEDSHVNIKGILHHFHNNGLVSGDYFVAEDTNHSMWVYYGSENNWADKGSNTIDFSNF